MSEPVVLSNPEGAVLEDGWSDVDEAHRVRFWDVLHRLGEMYGVQVVLTPRRSAARWESRYHPPRLLGATVRFERPGMPARKRGKKAGR